MGCAVRTGNPFEIKVSGHMQQHFFSPKMLPGSGIAPHNAVHPGLMPGIYLDILFSLGRANTE